MSSSEFGPMFVKKRFVLPLKMILHCTTVYVFWTKRWAHTMWSVNVGFPLFMVVHKIKSDSTRFIEQAGTFYPNISCPGTLGPDGIICLVRSDRILLVRKDSLKQNLTIRISVPVLRSCLGFHSSWLCIRSNQIWHALLSKRELFIQNSLRNVFFLIEFTNRELSVTQCNTIIN